MRQIYNEEAAKTVNRKGTEKYEWYIKKCQFLIQKKIGSKPSKHFSFKINGCCSINPSALFLSFFWIKSIHISIYSGLFKISLYLCSVSSGEHQDLRDLWESRRRWRRQGRDLRWRYADPEMDRKADLCKVSRIYQ